MNVKVLKRESKQTPVIHIEKLIYAAAKKSTKDTAIDLCSCHGGVACTMLGTDGENSDKAWELQVETARRVASSTSTESSSLRI